MKISDKIKDKSLQERSKIKCEELQSSYDKVITFKDVIVYIDSIETKLNNLWVTMRAFKKDIMIPLNNPFIFVNPPVMVPDGTKKIVKDIFNKNTEIDNFKEDPKEAFKLLIQHSVELAIKQWQH